MATALPLSASSSVLGVLLLALAMPTLFVLSSASVSGPAYFVSSIKSFSLGDPVDYEARTAPDFSSLLFSSLAKAAERGSHLPKVLLLLLASPQAHSDASRLSGDEKSGSDISGLDSVKEAVDLSPSSTVFTTVAHSCGSQSVVDALLARTEGSPASAAGNASLVTAVMQGGACAGAAEGAPKDVQSLVRAWAAAASSDPPLPGTALLLFCLPHSAAEQESGSVFLQAYHALEEASASSFAAVFVPEGGGRGTGGCRGRSLVADTPPPAAPERCDVTCRTKAVLWEGILVGVVLLIAVVSGLCCLSDLDTPSRFEAEREAS